MANKTSKKTITIDQLNNLAEHIIRTKKLLEAYIIEPQEANITMSEDDKRSIGTISCNEDIVCLSETLDDAINIIESFAEEVHTNAINERESYPEDSTHIKAQWLDDVSCKSEILRRHMADQDMSLTPNHIEIQVSHGKLEADISPDPNYPGIDIEYIPEKCFQSDDNVSLPRVHMEYPTESGSNLTLYVWNDETKEDYTHKHNFYKKDGSSI